MNVRSLEEPLADSAALQALVAAAGVTPTQARALLAGLSELPIRQAIRMAKAAHAERARQRQRALRMKR